MVILCPELMYSFIVLPQKIYIDLSYLYGWMVRSLLPVTDSLPTQIWSDRHWEKRSSQRIDRTYDFSLLQEHIQKQVERG